MVLSIGMIVKNEEKFLRRCLEGLKYIMDNVESELIICDTGSTDATVEIAKEFTEKVFEIEWKDDFAWARNQNLKRSKGQWYMVIDADEIFEKQEDAQGIIDFFNSGEYKKYYVASIPTKNMVGLTEANVFLAGRLYRIHKELAWHGKIHEYMSPLYQPIKKLDCTLRHYGYDYQNRDDMMVKHERNLKPMLEELEKSPNSIRIMSHLARQYLSVHELDEAHKYIERGMKLHNIDSEELYYHALYHQLCEIHLLKKEFEKCHEAVQYYFENSKLICANAFFIKYFESLALASLERFEEAAHAAVESLEYAEKKERNELDDFILSVVVTRDIPKAQLYGSIVGYFTVAGKFDDAVKWQEKSKNEVVEASDVYNIFVDHHIKKTPEKIVDMYDFVVSKFGINSLEYDNALTAIERNLTDATKKYQVAQALVVGREDFGDGYIRLQHMRIKDQEGDSSARIELDYFLNSNKTFSQHFGDILVSAVRNDVDISPVIDKFRIVSTMDFICNTFQSISGFGDVLMEYINKSNFINNCNNIKALRVVAGILSLLADLESDSKFKNDITYMNESALEMSIINSALEKMTEARIRTQATLFESYTRVKHKYLKLVYRDDVYCEEKINSIPEQDAFTFYSGRAFECKDAGDTTGFVQNLRLALNVLPAMIDIITRVGNDLQDEVSAPLPPTVQDQFDNETGKLKTIIYTMINTGNLAQAEQILNSYVEINPGDPDIDKIKEMINAG